MKLQTRVRSALMSHMASDGALRSRRRRARLGRKLRGAPPVVHYFHEVTDPYSHLAVQKLTRLAETWNIPVVPHLAAAEADSYRGDAERYPAWSRHDALSIADGYNVTIPEESVTTGFTPTMINAANNRLATATDLETFVHLAKTTGDTLWRGDLQPEEETTQTRQALKAGNKLRLKLGHYAGGMFWFDGEWYWGVDRLYSLEDRLRSEGYGGGADPVVPRPKVRLPPDLDAGAVTLEYFPSLRSPYTAVSFDATMAIADRTGIDLNIRPVIPMMMRGVPAPRRKALYILTDSQREGRAFGRPLGKIVDPFGEPVKRAYSLLPYVEARGRKRDFVSRYLAAAWVEGIDITSDAGLRCVIEDIDLEWNEARKYLDQAGWEEALDRNVNDMLNAGLWGVPSFRVSGGALAEPFSCWGQDRLWRVEAAIVEAAGHAVSYGDH